MEKKRFCVEGMSCAACVNHVNKAASKVKGVKSVSVNLLTKSMDVEMDDISCINKINEEVSKAGYKSYLQENEENIDRFEDKETKRLLKRLIISIIILIPLVYLSMGYMMGWYIGALKDHIILLGIIEAVLSLAIMIINKAFFVSGFKAIFHLSPNMDSLVALGSSVSFIYSLVLLIIMIFNHHNHELVMEYSMNFSFETSAMVPSLITIGKTLEAYSKGKTTNALKSLIQMSPKEAHVIRDGKEYTIKATEVVKGDVFVVKSGESVPVDGIIIEGNSSIDESMLTGESMPVDKNISDKVFSATINQNGILKCEAVNVGKDTTFSKIIALVEEASASKAPISRLADKVAGIFVPVVMGIVIIVFIAWLIISFNVTLDIKTSALTFSINRAISILVISCPCALGLATPVAIMVGSGIGAKNHILFKNAASIEETGKIDFVVLDKTGTITEGKPSISDINSEIDEDEFIKLAASIEALSSHPIAFCIADEANKRNIDLYDVSDFETLPGKGIKAKINGKDIYALNTKTMKEIITYTKEQEEYINSLASLGKTPISFAYDNQLIGILGIADEIKEDSIIAIKGFKEIGIIPIMLTGDNNLCAKYIASKAGIDYHVSDLLPEGKKEIIERIKRYGKVAMVGDGINDALALTVADVGIAIGSGTDVAIDSASIVLVKSSLNDALNSIKLSRQILKNIKENLFWAFFYNVIMIPIAAGVFYFTNIEFLKEMKPWYGALAMSLSSLFVVTNALRLNLFKPNKYHKAKKIVEIKDNFLFEDLNTNSITIKVDGMMCEHCVKTVEDVCKNIKNVYNAKASLENNNVVIEYNKKINLKKIKSAIEKAGYRVN